MATDTELLRDLLEDPDETVFSDAQLLRMLTVANNNITPTMALSVNQLYYAAYLGWLRKAGKVRVKNQAIAVFRKNTEGTHKAALAQAEAYLQASLNESGPDVVMTLALPDTRLVKPDSLEPVI